MDGIAKLSGAELDEYFLRRSFDVARRALAHGNHPFGAILVDENRNVLIEAENSYMPDHDGTAHAERLLARRSDLAPTAPVPEVLAKATPCVRRPSPARCAPARSTGRELAGWSMA